MKVPGLFVPLALLCGSCATTEPDVYEITPRTTYIFKEVCGNPELTGLRLETGDQTSSNRFDVLIVVEQPSGCLREKGHIVTEQSKAHIDSTSLYGPWELPGLLDLNFKVLTNDLVVFGSYFVPVKITASTEADSQ
jgi:hypothetical protein